MYPPYISRDLEKKKKQKKRQIYFERVLKSLITWISDSKRVYNLVTYPNTQRMGIVVLNYLKVKTGTKYFTPR